MATVMEIETELVGSLHIAKPPIQPQRKREDVEKQVLNQIPLNPDSWKYLLHLSLPSSSPPFLYLLFTVGFAPWH